MKKKQKKKVIQKLMNSVVLFIASVILSVILWPIWIIYTLWLIIRRIFIPTPNNPIIKTIGYLANLIYGIAKWIDQLGNVVCRDLFNRLLITRKGYKFWNVWETISSVLGKNQKNKTLTELWEWLVEILDSIEKDHCKKSIIYIIKENE